MGEVQFISKCRSCHSGVLDEVLMLGPHYVSGFVDEGEDWGPKVPLDLVLCDPSKGGCGLVQLTATTPPDWLYRQYWYQSGINPVMQRALRDIADQAERRVPLNADDVVLDIGCNDGFLLRSYIRPDLMRVGFEPARNLFSLAQRGTSKVINDYFNQERFQRELSGRKAKIITSIAMFYDLDDPNQFISEVAQCLDPEGLWIVEMSYLPTMLDQNAFDGICHEHLEYYSLFSVKSLFSHHGLEVVDVETNEINGGSFRLYIRHQGAARKNLLREGTDRVQLLEQFEKEKGLCDLKTYRDFAGRVGAIRERVRSLVLGEHSRGKTIYLYGASTKGNTLLQFFGLDSRLIVKAAERNPEKWGKKTVGTGIPIVSEEECRRERPDYLLMTPWHFLEEFKKRERAYLEAGGKFIVPLPELKVLGVADLKTEP